MVYMAKAEINLLPPAVKRERFSRLVRQRVSGLYWWVVLVLAATVVALTASWVVLKQTDQRLQVVAEQGRGTTDGTATTRSLNQLVRAMQSRVVGGRPWSPLVLAVLQAVPVELRMTRLEVVAASQSMVIEGTAASRVAVATFEQRLKGLTEVTKVEAPLTNLVVGREGTFSFTVQRKTTTP